MVILQKPGLFSKVDVIVTILTISCNTLSSVISSGHHGIKLFGLSVMLEHLLCIFSHPGYENFCISDTYTPHLILKADLITSDLPERQLTHKVAWLMPIRDGPGEIELSGFSTRKTSQVEREYG